MLMARSLDIRPYNTTEYGSIPRYMRKVYAAKITGIPGICNKKAPEGAFGFFCACCSGFASAVNDEYASGSVLVTA